MNNTLNIIAKRFSCRNFTDKEISQTDLQAIASAAIQSPSAMNRQGWHIVIVKNKNLIDEIEREGLRVMAEMPDKSAHERIKGRGGKLFYNAQAIAFIAIKNTGDEFNKKYTYIDMGIVAQNIALAATSLGIASCHHGMVSFCFMGEKKEEFNSKLNIPHGYDCSYGVLLGYAKEQSAPHVPDKSKAVYID